MTPPYSKICVLPFQVKADNDAKRQAVIDFATSDRDRQKDVLHPEGLMNLEDYLKNPIVGYNHDLWTGNSFPVGQALDVDVTSQRLRSKVQFDDDERSDLVYRKVKSGTLRTGSIGYDPLRVQYDSKADAYHIYEWNLYEQSIVTVPANPAATVQFVKSLGLRSDAEDPLDAFLKGVIAAARRRRKAIDDPLTSLIQRQSRVRPSDDLLASLLRR